ncbi:MAG: hydrolase, partial [Oscillospiraceae bacterium]|nr:hydrolase [Oscillospiraceae bacterium]
PHGDRPDGNDWTNTGETFRYLHKKGFRILCSVGIESFTAIKKDIAAVICDRMHPDGTTLRSASCLDRYMKFYDAREIIDLTVRPERKVGWQE